MKLYPMHGELKIHITDGEQVGEVSYSLPPQLLPTEELMAEAMVKMQAMLPDGFRFMDREESLNYWLREEKHYQGSRLALPPKDEGQEWYDPAVERAEGSTIYRDDRDEGDEE
jgi:hypothetical protein